MEADVTQAGPSTRSSASSTRRSALRSSSPNILVKLYRRYCFKKNGSTDEETRGDEKVELEPLSPLSAGIAGHQHDASTSSNMTRDNDKMHLKRASESSINIMGIPRYVTRLAPGNNKDYTALHIAVVNGNLEELKDLLQANNIDLNYKSKRHGYTALMLAVELLRNLSFDIEPTRIKILEYMISLLLEAGCNANTPDNKGVTPIYSAAEKGLINVVTMIIHHVEDPTDNDALFEPVNGLTLLHVTVHEKLYYNRKSNSRRNHNDGRIMCLNLFLEHPKIKVNHSDVMGNTALNYAARNDDDETVLSLLRHGACLSLRNIFNETPLRHISRKTLETYLDECITSTTYNYLSHRPSDKDYNICIYYGFLSYTEFTLETKKSGLSFFKDYQVLVPVLVPETDALLYMTENEELRSLLKHPVITSFLYLKWQRISCLAYANITFYSLLWLCLILYLIWGYELEQQQSDSIKALNNVTYIGTTIGLVLLIIRELFQLLLSPLRYVKGLGENVMEIVLIGIIISILCHNFAQSTKQQLSAVAILISSAELLFLMGQFPASSTNILMLKTVSWNFLKFLLWYCILIFAFALSFYTLFRQVKEDQTLTTQNKTVLNKTGNEDGNIFNDPFRSLFKTIVMLTGEFDASSIEFNTFPVTSHLIFIVFVFMIPIVLFNLLNGLAVSDTQKIMDDAELVGHISRVKLISHFESVLLGNAEANKNPTECWSWLTTYLQNIKTYVINLKAICIKPLAKRICLFTHILPEHKIVVTPNRDNKIWIPSREYYRGRESINDSNACFGRCQNYKLDGKIVQNAKIIISKKEDVTDLDEIKGTLSNYESKIESLDYIRNSCFKNESKIESLDEIKANVASISDVVLKYETKMESFDDIKATLLKIETKIEKLDEIQANVAKLSLKSEMKIENLTTKIEGIETTLNKVLQMLEKMYVSSSINETL